MGNVEVMSEPQTYVHHEFSLAGSIILLKEDTLEAENFPKHHTASSDTAYFIRTIVHPSAISSPGKENIHTWP